MAAFNCCQAPYSLGQNMVLHTVLFRVIPCHVGNGLMTIPQCKVPPTVNSLLVHNPFEYSDTTRIIPNHWVMFSSAIPNWGMTFGIPHQVTWPWHCSAPRKMQQIFASARIDDDAMCEAMKRSVAEFGYLPCPHTAVALGRCVSRSWNGSWKILKDASKRIQKRSSWYFSVHHPNFESVSGATASSWWFHGSAVSVLFT